MHHSLKIKILDLDHLESIFEQNITDVDAEKIVGGTLSLSKSQVALKNFYAIRGTLSDGLELVIMPNETIVHVPPVPPHPHPGWMEVD